jgi:uncharacterized RDD family membrane protein YckC
MLKENLSGIILIMINQQLLDFIKSQLQLGLSKETITKELLTNSWTMQDIEEGFNATKAPVPNMPNVLNPNLATSGSQPSIVSNPVVQSQPQVKYAGFWIRLVALFIDSLVLLIPSIIILFLLGAIGGNAGLTQETSYFLWIFIYSVMVLSYMIFMTYKYQATLGKKVVKIKVFSDKGNKLTLGQVILREFIGKFLSSIILYIGYIMIAFSKKKQGLHDKVAGTVVIYNDPSKKMPKWIIVMIILIFALPFIAGIFSAVILGSLNSLKNKEEIKINENLTPNPYVDNEYNFSFSYPVDIFVAKEESDVNLLDLGFYYTVSASAKDLNFIQKEFKLPMGGMTIGEGSYEQVIEKFKKSETLNNILEEKIEKNGIIWNTALITDTTNNTPAMKVISTQKNDLNYNLILMYNPPEAEINNLKEIIDNTEKMFLDTFQFTDNIETNSSISTNSDMQNNSQTTPTSSQKTPVDINNNSTPESSDAFNNAFKVSFGSSFIQSCQKEAGPASIYCGCMADYLVNNYTVIQLTEFNAQPEGAGIQQAFAASVSHCIPK